MESCDESKPVISGNSGIIYRWVNLLKDAGALTSDTLKAVVGAGQRALIDLWLAPAFNNNPSSTEHTPLESQPPHPQTLDFSPAVSPTQAIKHQFIDLALETPDTRPLGNSTTSHHPDRLSRQPSTSSSPKKHPPYYRNGIVTPFEPSQTPLSTHEMSSQTSASSLSDTFLKARKQESGSSGVRPRMYKNREHIYVKAHKANVRAELQKSKEEMQKEIYSIKRKSGKSITSISYRCASNLLRLRLHLKLQRLPE
ncbi:hypothetical protein H0H87_005869 [Tephrocybe sp. NHM501043]|nr:hypothetical protein H0H87_005869 [Tephrocybe sp. NHM501043]